jgi:ditrans,polycis-polyprenyl diphosphate synthase
LVEEKIGVLTAHWHRRDLLDKYGVRLNVIGKTELLPDSVRRAAQKAERMTRHNTRAILNLCMPYTARDEIATAVQYAVHEALLARLPPSPPSLDDPPYVYPLLLGSLPYSPRPLFTADG